MTAIAANPPIPGTPLDPPPIEVPELIQNLDEGDDAVAEAVGVVYRAVTRFNYARSAILAAGTTYYAFLAMFSLIALAYGITAMFGADRLATYLTQAISEAFPGLLGEEGIDPAELRAIGQAASAVGLVVMLYAGSGAMVAASSSIHLIYGAPPDPRNYVKKRVILLGWLIIIGPLIAFSFVAGTMIHRVSYRVFNALEIEGSTDRFLITLLAVVLTLAADVLVVYLILGRLGGIRPPSRALMIGSAAGAIALQLLRIPMGWILELSLDKPQYGALAIPIGILLVLYLNSNAIYGSAAFAAGIAEKDVPLDEIAPAIEIEEAQPDLDEDRPTAAT
ncbi:MAG: YhjD/YihY/BrkB family envelope integrity protein [Actinomycetota bacterium]